MPEGDPDFLSLAAELFKVPEAEVTPDMIRTVSRIARYRGLVQVPVVEADNVSLRFAKAVGADHVICTVCWTMTHAQRDGELVEIAPHRTGCTKGAN